MGEFPVTKIFPHDRLIAQIILPLIPRHITPNQVTIFRFLLTPIVIWLIAVQNYAWGIPLFLIAAFSDAVDGSMARTRDQITRWGIVYDPVADKLLIGSVLVLLVIQQLSFYLALAIIVYEFLMIIAALIGKRRGIIIQATMLGKTKMVLQVFGLLFLLIYAWIGNNFLQDISFGVLSLSLGFGLVNVIRFGFLRVV